jgi:hypothetical protein
VPGHRGAHPEDAQLFSGAELERLRPAARELAWLLGRGYPLAGALALVGGHHQLKERQRMALQRSVCAQATARARRAKQLPRRQVAGRALTIDGFNLVITLEVALSGGLILQGTDGVLRDLAGLRGSYRVVAETPPALGLLGDALARLRPESVHIAFDRPVANAGRLATLVRAHASGWPLPVTVELTDGVDRLVAASALCATGDAGIIDRCPAWVNLGRMIVDAQVPGAWRVRL